MNLASKLNEISIKGYLKIREFIPLVLIGMAIIALMPDDCFAAENRLAGLKGEVGATFGAQSDVPYFIMLAEGIGGAIAYSKTKNILMLAGVPILMVFTHWALK